MDLFQVIQGFQYAYIGNPDKPVADKQLTEDTTISPANQSNNITLPTINNTKKQQSTLPDPFTNGEHLNNLKKNLELKAQKIKQLANSNVKHQEALASLSEQLNKYLNKSNKPSNKIRAVPLEISWEVQNNELKNAIDLIKILQKDNEHWTSLLDHDNYYNNNNNYQQELAKRDKQIEQLTKEIKYYDNQLRSSRTNDEKSNSILLIKTLTDDVVKYKMIIKDLKAKNEALQKKYSDLAINSSRKRKVELKMVNNKYNTINTKREMSGTIINTPNKRGESMGSLAPKSSNPEERRKDLNNNTLNNSNVNISNNGNLTNRNKIKVNESISTGESKFVAMIQNTERNKLKVEIKKMKGEITDLTDKLQYQEWLYLEESKKRLLWLQENKKYKKEVEGLNKKIKDLTLKNNSNCKKELKDKELELLLQDESII